MDELENTEQSNTNPVGRPTLYKPEYCQRVIDIMSNGASVIEVSAELNICKKTFYEWTEQHKEFLHAYKVGQEKSNAWWEKLGRAGSAGQLPIQAATWIFNMKNRFNWKDKVETEHSGSVNMHFDKQDQGLL